MLRRALRIAWERVLERESLLRPERGLLVGPEREPERELLLRRERALLDGRERAHERGLQRQPQWPLQRREGRVKLRA